MLQPNKARTQPSSLSKPHSSLVWKNLKENMVANNQLQRSPSVVNITLLATLGSNKVLLNGINLFNGFLDIIQYGKMLVANFNSIGWRSGRPTIESFKWGHTDIGVVAVITSKFVLGKLLISTATKV